MLKLSLYPRVTIMLICLSMASATFFVYRDVATHEFTIFDDPGYITKNVHVQHGIRAENIRWAFSEFKTEELTYWHPLTWLSHMLDCQLFGLSAGKHLLVNLSIHASNALLLFIVFYYMTGALYTSGFMAALFALHPLNVESVAWAAERKNVLSTFFWLLTMITYVYYTRRSHIARYILMLAMFLLGLLSKPMLVTLPIILLLLDVWPLRRYTSRFDFIRLSIEKIPMAILAFIIFALVYFSLQTNTQVLGADFVSMGNRVENLLVSYFKYLVKVFWPHPLAVYYPFPTHIPLWQTIGAGVALGAITLTAMANVQRAPWLFVGWFWFIASLLPVSGIIQGGLWPEMADRWAYVPAIGLFVIIAWGWDAVRVKIPIQRSATAMSAIAVLVVFAFLTQKQVSYWQNSKTLFEHALNAVPENWVSLQNYGAGLEYQGLTDQAIEQYYKSIKLNPYYWKVHTSLGIAFYRKGMYDKAIQSLLVATQLNPNSEKAQWSLAEAYAAAGQFEKALAHYAKALSFKPDNPINHYNMGVAYYKLYRYDKAIHHIQEALRLKPDYEDARNALNMMRQIKN